MKRAVQLMVKFASVKIYPGVMCDKTNSHRHAESQITHCKSPVEDDHSAQILPVPLGLRDTVCGVTPCNAINLSLFALKCDGIIMVSHYPSSTCAHTRDVDLLGDTRRRSILAKKQFILRNRFSGL